MSDPRRFLDSGGFWLAVGILVIALTALPAGLAIAQVQPHWGNLWSNRWFDVAILGEVLGILALLWSLILFMSHRHLEAHLRRACPDAHAHQTNASRASATMGRGEPGADDAPGRQPVGIASNRQPAATGPSPQPRTVIDRTPEQLTANFKDVTSVEGEDRIARYLGTWMRVSGPLGDVASITPTITRVTFSNRSFFKYNNVVLTFEERRWAEYLKVMKPGDHLAVLGQITAVGSQDVHLDNCEIETTP